MKRKFAFTKGRLIVFFCCTLLPAAAMGFGIFLLTRSVVFRFSFAVTYVLIPLIAVGLLAWCIFSGCKPLPKVILSGAIIVLFVVSFVLSFVLSGFEQVKHYEGEEAERQYTAAKGGNTLMPELSEIGGPTDIEYHNVFISMFIFSAETDYLICRYTPDEYQMCKEALETEYTFQTETIRDFRSQCEPSAEVNGYQFRLLSIEEYQGTIYYPKHLILIGYSDDTREIVYVAFEDVDLDYITSLEEFIADDCGWKYIR